MTIISRPLSPGEVVDARGGTQVERQFNNRIYLGKIRSVDEDNGVVSVDVFGVGQHNQILIPLHAISIHKTRSSWIRYMPQSGDYVKVGFGPDNHPEILTYALYGDDPTDGRTDGNPGSYAPRVSGYKQIRRLKERSDAGEKPGGVPLGLRDFIPLRQGEWDLRSSGGAYIHGSQFGVVTLSAGQNVIKVDKPNEEVSAETQLFKLDAGNETFIRLGDIKRKLTPADTGETTVSASISGIVSTREYHLKVSQVVDPTGVTPPLTVYEEKMGDIRDDDGVPTIPIPLLVSKAAYTAGVQMYGFSVDNLGAVTLSAPGPVGKIYLKGGPAVLTTYAAVRAETLALWLTTQLSVLTAFGPSGPAVVPFLLDGGLLSPASLNVQVS